MIRVGLPEDPEPEDGEPSAHPDGSGEFAVPEQPPGNPGWMRAFTETTAAQREPFADGAQRLPAFDPVYWHGDARERFAQARDSLTGQWRTVLDTHDDVLRRVEGHSTFVHQLQHLWDADRGNPAALLHTAQVHRTAAAELAALLLQRAAELDAVARDQVPPPDPPGVVPTVSAGRVGAPRTARSERTGENRPEFTAAPTPEPPTPEPEPPTPEPSPEPEPPEPEPSSQLDPVPEPDAVPGTDFEPRLEPGDSDDLATNGHEGEPVPPVTAPPDGDAQHAPTTPAHRYQLTEKLGEQLVTGVRQYRILWEGVRRA